MDGVVGSVLGHEGDARAPDRQHARQFENGSTKDLVEIEGRVDERRQLGEDLEYGDGDASAAGAAEAGRHRVRRRAMTAPIDVVSRSSARKASVTLAFVAAPSFPCHSLPNDSRRSA